MQQSARARKREKEKYVQEHALQKLTCHLKLWPPVSSVISSISGQMQDMRMLLLKWNNISLKAYAHDRARCPYIKSECLVDLVQGPLTFHLSPPTHTVPPTPPRPSACTHALGPLFICRRTFTDALSFASWSSLATPQYKAMRGPGRIIQMQWTRDRVTNLWPRAPGCLSASALLTRTKMLLLDVMYVRVCLCTCGRQEKGDINRLQVHRSHP